MGDWFQTVGDVEAGPDEVEGLLGGVLEWLVGAGIVRGELSECVLGGRGYAPGPRALDAVEAPDLDGPWSDGMEVRTGRVVYDCGADPVEWARCPHCGVRVRFDDDEWGADEGAWEPFDRAVKAWCAGGEGAPPCPACGRAAGLNAWAWEPAWGFGHLGFTFWNWPPLTPAFVAEFSRRLGHRVVVAEGKF